MAEEGKHWLAVALQALQGWMAVGVLLRECSSLHLVLEMGLVGLCSPEGSQRDL